MGGGARRGGSGVDEQACQELLVPGRPDPVGLVERLARCLGNDLRQHALRRCGRPEDAEDAVQEAMATAMRYLSGFRGETSLRIWLLRLINTACIHQRRGRRNDPARHTSLDVGGWGQTLADGGPLVEEALLVEEKLRTVVEVLQSLPAEDRALLVRHEAEDASLAQLAEETGQTVAAVRSRLFRLRQRLRTQLERLLHGDVQG
ncbi:MAG: RNA polymerase sigma factor [Deltaproteobacteria bacterium]|nr:RNA polymerase sigma factor [Deltaproteobacteria bacterium]